MVRPASLLLAFTALAAAATALTCPAGTWKQGDHCQACQSGYQCPDGVNQTPCNAGTYANSGNTACVTCPAGSKCPNSGLSAPTPCDAGQYQSMPGQSNCNPCPAGTYTGATGQTGCCPCCVGSFNSQTSQTHCQACANGKNSPAGSTGQNQCTGTAWTSPPTCTTPSTATTCPATSQRRARSNAKAKRTCPKFGQKLCPILYGRGGSECVDVENDLESCGGCMDADESLGGGVDCTQISGARDVACRRGKCVVTRCAPGYQVAEDRTTCVPSMKMQAAAARSNAKVHAAFARSHL
ncbi:hypothetical protein CALCODRAFT_486247 [Calocera cornea HHB12733]|uniref:Tyrosine-protein kinase ephrin type A/B receptor-like domain-containing protein n=1 Tax=Calocera cornea HHB12733 TaxID=1353952 RepID=A0A165DUD5_9BASI|nr:hypothetical protein CALCODRAFT_486247 [Calocera cornea HHB12733]